MSGIDHESGNLAQRKDPLLRFLAGCAVVAGVIVAIVVGGAVLIGWRLGRDEAPGRAQEAFLVGDESRYWRADLKADDQGLKALFARIEEINDSTRRDILRGTFFEGVPVPHRRARLEELAPFSLELGLAMSDPASGQPAPAKWAARGTFSHGVFRMRAAMKLIRFLASRDATRSETIDVDGVKVTELHGTNAGFAIATIGNRVLVTSDAHRMREVLTPAAGSQAPGRPELVALHQRVELPGEDAWGLIAATRVGQLSTAFPIDGAAASFDINDRDELAFRVIVAAAARGDEGNAFRGTREDCRTVAAALLPGVPEDALEIDGEGAGPEERGARVFTGRVPGLSRRLADLVLRAKGLGLPGRGFAIPNPPSPKAPADPRSDTPAAPTREGTPRPPR